MSIGNQSMNGVFSGQQQINPFDSVHTRQGQVSQPGKQIKPTSISSEIKRVMPSCCLKFYGWIPLLFLALHIKRWFISLAFSDLCIPV